MDYPRLAENPVHPNPNYSPYPTNPSPIFHPNQDPRYNPPQFYHPSVDHQNVYNPPPRFELQPPMTVTVSYVPPYPEPGYYQDPNVSWGAGYGQLGAAVPPAAAGVILPNAATQVQNIQNVNKAPKKTKIVQSQWCEVCKIDCNSKDVLDNHKLGKKHRKNLEKLRGPIITLPGPTSVSASAIVRVPEPTSSNNPVIGPPEKPDEAPSTNAKKAKRKKAAASEDLESKRQKILDCGAAAEAIRMCTYCNVVCNSDAVFSSHIAGQKHAAMVGKHALLTGSASAV